MFPVKRGIVKPYNQDTLDVWLLRDGLNIVYDHKVKEVSSILHDLGWRADKKGNESLAFEDKIGYVLFRVDKYLGLSGQYSFDSHQQEAKDLREDLSGLVEDMDAVLTALGHEIEWGTGSYIINE